MRLLLAALLAALAAPARAAFTDLGAGARAPGMGNAFTAVADDLYAIYYNPAGLAQLDRPQFSAAYARLYMGLSDGSDLGLSHVTYASPLRSGRWGVLGGGFQRFALDSIYSEQSLYLSWGRRVLQRESGSRLLLGLNFKYLSRSFSQLPEAFNACNDGGCSGLGADPVLSGATSKSTMDADFGLLYRFPRRFQLGLAVQHLMEPDVGFAGSDKLGRNIRFGVGYKSLWMNLTGELRMDASPTGSADRDLIVGAERYFPTLDYGQFGVRGSMGLGSRDFRQFTMGMSYRINKIQTDYAFLLPIGGGVKGTAGTHRLAMTFHFGAPTQEEELTQDLLLQAQRMREGKEPGYGYEFADHMKPRDLSDPALTDVRLLVDRGEFRKAQRRLMDIAKTLPPDVGLNRLGNRLALTAYYYSDIVEPQTKWEILTSSAIRSFLWTRDRQAVLLGSYALSINPNNAKLDNYLKQVEEGVGIKGERLPPGHPRSFLQELLHRVEAAHNRGEYEKVLTLLGDILLLEPENVTAISRVGSTYFILERYQEALDTWERAYPMEKDARERRALVQYMGQAREKLGLGPVKVEELPTEVRPAAPSPEAAPPPRTQAPRPAGDPRDVQRLYQKGVEHYARGEYLQATAMFMRILQIDPNNAAAKKALERLRR